MFEISIFAVKNIIFYRFNYYTMKLSHLQGLLIFISILFFSQSNAQAFWTETFGSGCNTGTLANGFTSPNGTWSVTNTGTNGANANVWYVSAEENGQGIGNCGAGCGSNPTLHLGASGVDIGAAYLNGDGGIGLDATTDKRAESPVIDCSGQCDVELSFEYLENGDGALDNLILWYFDGTTWSSVEDTPKTPLTCAPQGEWTARSITLPSSADNNPNVQIGFQWVNNNDNIGTDPSAAIYNIQLTSGDTDAPVLICVGSVDVYVNSSCDAQIPDLVLPPFVTVTDNCSSLANISVTQDVASGTILSGHLTNLNVEVSATDGSGNVGSCIINVQALDTVSPVLTCPANQPAYTDVNCQSTIDDYLTSITVSDNCTSVSNLVLTQDVTSGTTISNDQTVQITAVDEAGNSKTCSFVVQLTDTVSPIVTCPGDQTQEAVLGTCDTLIQDFRGLLVWSDNCTSSASDMTFQQTPAPLTSITGISSVTLIAIDSAGNSNSCEFEVSVLDLEDPTITCPGNQNLPTNASCDANLPDYTGSAVATDNCPTPVGIDVTQSPAPGTLVSGLGTVQTVTLTAEDDQGNTSSCVFEVTLTDTTSPQVTCPADATENSNASCQFSMVDYTGSASVVDNCYSISNITVTQDVTVGSNLSAGINVIEISAEDLDGNIGTCTFELTIEDNTSPVISTCASDQVEAADSVCNAELTDYTSLVSATDNCNTVTDLTVTQSPAVGTVISAPTTVTLTVTDLSGNASTCDFEVTIDDQIKPLMNCLLDTVVNIDVNCQYLAPDLTGEITGSDNCSDFGDMTVSQSPAPGTSMTGLGTIEIVLTDENGNSTTCDVAIIPNDSEAPIISCPGDQFVNNGTDCDYQITDFTSMGTVTDNCPGSIISQIPVVGDEIGTGTHQVELIATDVFGNTDTCSFELVVAEAIAPTINCPSDTVSCEPLIVYDSLDAADNCSGFSVSQIDATGFTSGDEFPVGITVQTYEVTDLSGNTATCSFNVEILASPSQANILTSDTELCDTTSIVLEADPITSGTGGWVLASGSGNFNNQFANITGINNMGYGTNAFVWEISSLNCGSSTDTVFITVYEEPSLANTQNTLYLCADTSLNISANQPSVGVGTWGDINGNVSFLNDNSPNTLSYGFIGGWNDLTWTISNGNCPTNSDTLRIFNKLETEIYTGDTSVCSGDEIVLFGTETPESVSSIWYIIGGAADFESASNSSTLVYNLGGGENIVVYGQNHPVCGTTLDTITITVGICGEYDPVLPTVITPNNDGVNDLFVIKGLNILYPESEVKIVNRWGGLVFESTGYEEPWNGTKMNEGGELPMGTYFYRIILNDNEGTEITGPISIIR
jgi:gliding motility-associated-like protein